MHEVQVKPLFWRVIVLLSETQICCSCSNTRFSLFWAHMAMRGWGFTVKKRLHQGGFLQKVVPVNVARPGYATFRGGEHLGWVGLGSTCLRSGSDQVPVDR